MGHKIRSVSRGLCFIGISGILVFGVGSALADQTDGNFNSALFWLGDTESRLHSQIGDLLEVEMQANGPQAGRNSSMWETHKFAMGSWSATTTFFVVDGRVKRLSQEAMGPADFCSINADWGQVGSVLSNELDVEPMVYAPTSAAGKWQQAALWHVKRVTAVLYRTFTEDGGCQVRLTAQ